jgi:integrase
LRISDILNIKAKYINKTIYIKEQKTKKHKIVELSDELYERLKPIADYNDHSATKYVFKSPSKPQKHLHRTTYHRHLKQAAKALKINFSAHSTRKLYAMNIFESTKNIFEVQKALNHKYVTTTAAYLDIDINALIAGAVATPET